MDQLATHHGFVLGVHFRVEPLVMLAALPLDYLNATTAHNVALWDYVILKIAGHQVTHAALVTCHVKMEILVILLAIVTGHLLLAECKTTKSK